MPDHPSHPDNHSVGSSLGSGASVDVVVSPGVSAEKLMYDRALEMSRTAAINELTGEDLSGCEIAYVTAIRMLEAVLENGEVPRFGQDKDDTSKDSDKIVLDAVQADERQVVIKRESLPPSRKPTSADDPGSCRQHPESASSSSQEAGDSCETSTDTFC